MKGEASKAMGDGQSVCMADKRHLGDNVVMNEEQPTPEQPTEAPLVEVKPDETLPLEPQSQDPRRRLRELLAIPDRDRTDAVWDEIIGLEIELAPGNRATSPQADAGRRQESGRRQEPGRRPEQARRQEPPSSAKPVKRFFKRPRRGQGAPTKRFGT